MKQLEAYREMQKGNKVRNEYYSPEEYAFINSDNKIETEDGCVHGGRYDEFWHCYQSNLGGEWSVVEENINLVDHLEPCDHTDKFIEHFSRAKDICDMDFNYYEKADKLNHSGYYANIRTEPKINRNSICACGSGLKYKKCCINK